MFKANYKVVYVESVSTLTADFGVDRIESIDEISKVDKFIIFLLLQSISPVGFFSRK